MIRKLWVRAGGGGGGGAVMPMDGGLLAWPAYLVAAFGIMDETASILAAARHRREAGRRGRGDRG